MYVVQKDDGETEETDSIAVCDTLEVAVKFLKSFFNNGKYTKIITYRDSEAVGGIMIEGHCEKNLHILWIQEVNRLF